MPTKILAIDDSKTMRLAIKITFAAEDCEVVAVSKGSEAVARAKQMGADILLVDAQLAAGEPNGYEVCKAMRADSATKNTPVIIMESNQRGIDDAKVKACGANGAITKPFVTQDVIDKVKALVGSKPSTSAGASASAGRGRAAPPRGRTQAPPKAASGRSKPSFGSGSSSSSGSRRSGGGLPSRGGSSGGGEKIPVAIPIPFASAGSPTPGMLKRLKEAGGGASGLDPKAVNALLALSRDVIEQVVWEVVPELAESIIKEQRRAGGR